MSEYLVKESVVNDVLAEIGYDALQINPCIENTFGVLFAFAGDKVAALNGMKDMKNFGIIAHEELIHFSSVIAKPLKKLFDRYAYTPKDGCIDEFTTLMPSLNSLVDLIQITKDTHIMEIYEAQEILNEKHVLVANLQVLLQVDGVSKSIKPVELSDKELAVFCIKKYEERMTTLDKYYMLMSSTIQTEFKPDITRFRLAILEEKELCMANVLKCNYLTYDMSKVMRRVTELTDQLATLYLTALEDKCTLDTEREAMDTKILGLEAQLKAIRAEIQLTREELILLATA